MAGAIQLRKVVSKRALQKSAYLDHILQTKSYLSFNTLFCSCFSRPRFRLLILLLWPIGELAKLGNSTGEKNSFGQRGSFPVRDDHVGLASLHERAEVHVHKVLPLK